MIQKWKEIEISVGYDGFLTENARTRQAKQNVLIFCVVVVSFPFILINKTKYFAGQPNIVTTDKEHADFINVCKFINFFDNLRRLQQ